MITSVKTRAYANIALVKYWGKQTSGINCPATPSLSLAIDSLKTETTIQRNTRDSLVFNGTSVPEVSRSRVFEVINAWRKHAFLDGHFAVATQNSFPAEAGLASSASGVAALTAGLGRLAKRVLDNDTLNRLARRGSGSAARSLTGGLSILPNDNDPVARQIIPPDEIPWCMVIAITDMQAKQVGSRDAMELCRLTSPYYDAWLSTAQDDYHDMLDAVEHMDFSRVGVITERNCLAMHACTWTSRPPLIYWNAVTINIICAVRLWRADGLESYFTIDAGPQVCLLTERHNAEKVAGRLKNIPGIKKILVGFPAGGAEEVQCL